MEIEVKVVIDFTVEETVESLETPQDELSEFVNVYINDVRVTEIDCFTAYKLGLIHAKSKDLVIEHKVIFDKTDEDIYWFKRINGMAMSNPIALRLALQNEELWK